MVRKSKRGMYFTGIAALEEKLKENVKMTDVKNIVKKNAANLQKEAKRRAVFKGHFEGDVWVEPTGFTKRSIGIWSSNGGLTKKVGPQSEYAYYLEYGTRFMASQPFIGPAYRAIKREFMLDMNRLVK